MNEDELNQRRIGFMKAVNLLTNSGDPDLRDKVLNALDAFGEDLHSHIESDDPSDDGPAPNPCPPGFYWDANQKMCVPIIID
jgi:hypothetical protein